MNTNITNKTKWQTVRKNGRKTNVERIRLKKQVFELLQTGLTQKETAKKVGLCKETVRIWAKQKAENSTTQPQPEILEIKADVLGLLKQRFIKMLKNENSSLNDLVTMNNLINEYKTS